MRKRKRRNKVSVPVASMGDIAFLLIIFFMVCSNFAKDNYQVDLPNAAKLEQLEKSNVTVGIDAQGVIYFQGKPVDSQGVEYAVAAFVERKVRELPPGADENTARMVLFRCDQSVSREIYVPVIGAISRGGGIVAALGEGAKE
jgi:biopolymer transport protein ExbD